MELRDYLRALRSRWLVVVLCAAIGIGLGAVYVLASPTRYESQTQFFVSTTAADTDLSAIAQGGQFSEARVQSYADIVGGPKVAQEVASRIGDGLTAKTVEHEVTATAPSNTVLLDITVTDQSPSRAQQIALNIGEIFPSTVQQIEATDTSGRSPVKVSVVKPATFSDSPVSPKTTLDIGLALLVGLLIGVGGAVLRETLDNTVKSPEDVEAATKRPAIGVIAYDPEAKSHPLIVAQHPHSTRAEAFRQLRTNLQFVDIDSAPKSIVFTSSVPNEGKTTTVCNLAITLAQAGSRVLVIEADLRRPRLAEYLGLDNSIGLTSVLVGTVSITDAVQHWGSGSLSVLASGPLPPNPSELLSSQAMSDLLRWLESRYDVILLDAPPLLPVTDAAVLATATSGAVLIARHGSTKRDQLARAAESLTDGVGARILGCVINMTPKRGRDAYYYGYAYSYQRRGSRRSPHTTGQTAEVLPKMPTLADDALHAAPVIRPTRSPVDELDPIITERPPREASAVHNHEASPPANGGAESRPLRVGRPPNHD